MAKPLTAEQIARACVLRSQRMSWENISADPGVRCNKGRIRNAVVAEGYPSSLAPLQISNPEFTQEVYDAYMTEDLDKQQSLDSLAARYGISKYYIKACVLAMGGKIRKRGTAKVRRSTQRYKPWGKGKACTIGAYAVHVQGGRGKVPLGSHYCAEVCGWRDGMCNREATRENILGFERFKTARAEHERKIAGDRKTYKKSHDSKATQQEQLAREMRGERDE